MTTPSIVERVLAGDARAVARAISLLEDDERASRFISRFSPEKCYDGLLRDAVFYSLG